MKLAYMVITTSSWLHQMIVMLTILFLFTWILLIWHWVKDITIDPVKWEWVSMTKGRRDKRRTRGRHMKISATLVGVDPPPLHPEHGDRVTGDEWVYTSLDEDNTAERHCTVFLYIKLVFHKMTYTLLNWENVKGQDDIYSFRWR